MPKTKPKHAGGRPKGPPTTVITFRADAEMMAAIKKITEALEGQGMAPGSVRAVAIRRAILAAAERASL